MKFYSKIKSTKKLGYRTPDHFKGQVFGNKKPLKLNSTRFKVQHKVYKPTI